jgi:hypothetical protein
MSVKCAEEWCSFSTAVEKFGLTERELRTAIGENLIEVLDIQSLSLKDLAKRIKESMADAREFLEMHTKDGSILLKVSDLVKNSDAIKHRSSTTALARELLEFKIECPRCHERFGLSQEKPLFLTQWAARTPKIFLMECLRAHIRHRHTDYDKECEVEQKKCGGEKISSEKYHEFRSRADRQASKIIKNAERAGEIKIYRAGDIFEFRDLSSALAKEKSV